LSVVCSAALLGACAQEEAPPLPADPVLAHVGEQTITEGDFNEVLQRLGNDHQALTLEQWRQQFQLLVDRELMMHEARRRSLHEDETVLNAVQAWERNRLVSTLIELEMGDGMSWTEQELSAFYEEMGAGSEIRLQRIDVDNREKALGFLEQLRDGTDFTQLAAANSMRPMATDWLNPLMVDARYAPLFLLEKGTVELIEAEDRYLLVKVADKREVSLDERRELVERTLRRQRQQEANINFLALVAERHSVQIDTAALAQVIGGGGTSELRLLKSNLGEWTLGQYQDSIKRLQQADSAPATTANELGFRITRAYVADQLLAEEARSKGLYGELTDDRKRVLQQKILESMWESDIYSQVEIDESDLRAFYEQNKARYASIAGNAQTLSVQVGRDLREAKAAPIFDEFIANLRQQSADQVRIDEDNFREFVARQRQSASPIDM